MALLHTVTLDSVRYYDARPSDVDDGDDVFVLVHGLGVSLDFWNVVAPTISRHSRTIAFDVPGFGRSASPPGRFDLSSVAEKSERFLDAIGVRGTTLVGHSLGALLTLRIAADRPDLVRRVVLVAGSLLTVEKSLTSVCGAVANPRLTAVLALQFLEGLIPMGPRRARMLSRSTLIRRIALGAYVAEPGDLNPRQVADAIYLVGGGGAINVVRVLAAAKHVRLEQLMTRVRQPTALVWGRQDPLVPAGDIEKSRRLLSVTSELALENCGHWPLLEYADEVAEFLIRLDSREDP
jgi:pimeloyl-ACP methyl ester carboxylesterase